jgi:hypothetical protein
MSKVSDRLQTARSKVRLLQSACSGSIRASIIDLPHMTFVTWVREESVWRHRRLLTQTGAQRRRSVAAITMNDATIAAPRSGAGRRAADLLRQWPGRLLAAPSYGAAERRKVLLWCRVLRTNLPTAFGACDQELSDTIRSGNRVAGGGFRYRIAMHDIPPAFVRIMH